MVLAACNCKVFLVLVCLLLTIFPQRRHPEASGRKAYIISTLRSVQEIFFSGLYYLMPYLNMALKKKLFKAKTSQRQTASRQKP